MWIVTQHPYVASTIVVIALCVIVILLRAVIRALRTLFSDAENALTAT